MKSDKQQISKLLNDIFVNFIESETTMQEFEGVEYFYEPSVEIQSRINAVLLEASKDLEALPEDRGLPHHLVYWKPEKSDQMITVGLCNRDDYVYSFYDCTDDGGVVRRWPVNHEKYWNVIL